MIVVNAGTQAGDFEWIRERVSATTSVENISEATGKLDLQGPRSPALLQSLLDEPLDGLKYFAFRENRFNGRSLLVSRTGYTGEIGFELYADPETTLSLWDACLEAGAVPAGLGARDTLRLEVGLPLYGHEMTAERNAVQSGFTNVIADDKDFIGAAAIRGAAGTGQRLIGCVLDGRRAAREGDRFCLENGDGIGVVTSGSFAPSLGQAVAMGYVDVEHCRAGLPVQIETARQALRGSLQETPFYKNGTVRMPLRAFLETAS